ncbi:MAG TPA: thiamine pyrophosphate-dependent enzyme [Anaerohalosphaeraceae bacterium]|nr:indolepyruvate ferredoxin oxidoreductase subunit alpha [Phycisphaerae bacterium]HOL32353.1 thiamine pyrophosphate-dependent enzyme [Anaerohalosphaeraceae bacterium]HOM75504.1 thiamine pyrophosphate-dependent enzyme [Anaerohalosphaeraceae bacterium]HPC64921.1 thiamine pyrophosphate-dependent enzyme [Anaerohalosphaeraceae bacterium]HPO70020.1 thiamine pyrophosphate-dependent enzyme [Anaerohalosphaeraceae bacterium]
MAKKTSVQKAFLSGNEALARGAWEAGLTVACAYPGTPSTEILESLALYPELDVQWSVNEKAAYEVAYSAAVGGVRSLFACKHVGLNVAMDPLMTSSYTGVNAGFVAVVCDDPGMHSSQNEQDTRWAGIYAKLPILEPASPAEAKQFVAEAFAISEKYDTPVILRMTTRVSHSKEDVLLGQRRPAEKRPLKPDIQKYVMVPAFARQRHALVEQRQLKLQKLSERSRLNKMELNDLSVGFIAGGVSYYYLKEARPNASFLKLGFLYPFCDAKIKAFAGKVKKLVVVEELDPFIEDHIRQLGIKKAVFRHPSFRLGELGPGVIEDVIAGRPKKAVKLPPARPPRLCAGCPHWATFSVLKKLGLFVAGDIGCYTLGTLPPTSALHTCLCMGAGVTFNEGLRRAHPDGKIVGVIGDSTFIHAGITGLINAAYNKAKGIIFILDNSTTAMTGGQNHPGTGLTIRGQPTKTLDLKALCLACGADNVDVMDPAGNVGQLEELVRRRLSEDALTVIIAKHPCKLIKR